MKQALIAIAALFSLTVCAHAESVTAPPLPSLPLSVANGGSGSSAQPKMQGTRITSAQTVTPGSFLPVQFNSIAFDTAGYWNGTTFRYVPLIAGTYQACGLLTIDGTTVTSITEVISKNGAHNAGGTDVAYGDTTGLATASEQSFSVGCPLVAMNGTTDSLELDTLTAGTGTLTIQPGVSTMLNIQWVSP